MTSGLQDRPGPGGGVPSQLVDLDPVETEEWVASLDGAVDQGGRARARWLAAVESDTSPAPRSVKILRHKPADAVDACFIDGVKITDLNRCRATFPHYADPRIAAGAPMSNDVLKCRLQPLTPRHYTVNFTAGQWSRLRTTFPHGVCDYSKPGIERVPSVPWQTYTHGPRG